MQDNPNIVYILADDMGYGDLTCLNPNSKINTVHLDQLASEGMVFRDAHASSAVCTPSRYSILTGRYNWRSRLKQGVTTGFSEPIIEPQRMTVASLLQSNGYRTACIGKWHLGWHWAKNGPGDGDIDYEKPIRSGPTSLGFDTFFGISASLDMPPYVYIENETATAVPEDFTFGRLGKAFWRPGPIASDFKHEEVLPKLTERVLQTIDRRAKDSSPFFIYFPLPAPHTPMLPDVQFQGQSGTNEYGDFCLQVDHVIGQIMGALEKNELVNNTILIFTSDNGCSPRADLHQLAGFGHHPSYIFRGHKADIYEGGHRVPLIIRWPDRIAPGTVCDETVCLGDLLATCAEILGTTLANDAGEDSVSNFPAWLGQDRLTPAREAIVHSSLDGSLSIRQGGWKLEMCAGSGGWSYPRPGSNYDGLLPAQLYDLQADIGERNNLYETHPDIIQRLQELLTKYIHNGRSTAGEPQVNDGDTLWEQLWWMQ
ncbi:MAG: sulfatase-like hydrolase/transferase [Candidatus Promineifilaceae bacterium]|nr:sulfatase-like hydrolase/transferase [Candidatus Promineifilaceae bacterium]